jgi:hypothetical protein
VRQVPHGDVLAPVRPSWTSAPGTGTTPKFRKVQACLNGGAASTFNDNRFWAQVDVATGYADFAPLPERLKGGNTCGKNC